jgi:hypothetical protein
MNQIVMTDYAIGICGKINESARRGRGISKRKGTNKHRGFRLPWRCIQCLSKNHILMLGQCVDQWSRRFGICPRKYYVKCNNACAQR